MMRHAGFLSPFINLEHQFDIFFILKYLLTTSIKKGTMPSTLDRDT